MLRSNHLHHGKRSDFSTLRGKHGKVALIHGRLHHVFSAFVKAKQESLTSGRFFCRTIATCEPRCVVDSKIWDIMVSFRAGSVSSCLAASTPKFLFDFPSCVIKCL